ncbi:putative membrane protein [Escherichia coli 5-366-08_S1_C3]|nr:putative membrane protein [Escherichia coli 5-366-08_S1_C3]
MFCWQFRDRHLAPGWLYALSQCGLFVVLFVVFIVGMGMSAFRA